MKNCLSLLLLFILAVLSTGRAWAEVIWPLPGKPAVVLNTLSTLQFYGPTPGFHHGLDLAAPAGTPVVAPVSGSVETGHYYKRKSDYTYEIAITTSDGDRWELHHIDPDDIPPEIERRADAGGKVTAGAHLGRIYDASAIGIEPHLHINILSAQGMYLNPFIALSDLGDEVAPTVSETWWAEPKGDRYVEVEALVPGEFVLVIDAFDIAPGEFGRQSLYRMRVRQEGETIFEFQFDALPHPSFLEGTNEIYFLGELKTRDGQILRSEVQNDRRFLYAVPVKIPSADPPEIEIVTEDFAGNTSRHRLRGEVSD